MDRMMRTFLGTYAAALADFQTNLKMGSFFHNALRRAIQPASTAFNAFISVNDRSFGPPVSRFKGRILRCNRAQIVGDGGLIKGFSCLTLLHHDSF
jgi:hypothetical protein